MYLYVKKCLQKTSFFVIFVGLFPNAPEGNVTHPNSRNTITHNPHLAHAPTQYGPKALVSVRRCVVPRQHQYQLRRTDKKKAGYGRDGRRLQLDWCIGVARWETRR